MIDEHQADCTLDLNILCAEDGDLIGSIQSITKATQILQDVGIILGYQLEVGKSKLWWPTVDSINFWCLKDPFR